MDDAYVEAAILQFNRFKTAIDTMSNGQMTANLDIRVVDTPVTSLTNIGPMGFWAGPDDIRHILRPYLESGKYDSIMVHVRFSGFGEEGFIPMGWHGLASEDVFGGERRGYTIINMGYRLDWYYDPSVRNQYYVSAEVHEFIHTLEFISRRKGILIADNDGNPPWDSMGYGTFDDDLGEWEKFQRDYLNCNINNIDPPPPKVGFTQETYMLDRYGPNITIYEILELVDPPSHPYFARASKPFRAF